MIKLKPKIDIRTAETSNMTQYFLYWNARYIDYFEVRKTKITKKLSDAAIEKIEDCISDFEIDDEIHYFIMTHCKVLQEYYSGGNSDE